MLSDKLPDNRFLIVDSYPFGRDTLRRTLLSIGAQYVDIAVSADNAIDLCKRQDYDMVLSDYDLGGGKNGQQLLEELRNQKLLKNVSAFVVLTSETTRDVVLSTLELQPDDYIAKPYIESLLVRRVRRLLRYKCSLHEIFQSIDSENYQLAIADCEGYLLENTSFESSCLRLTAELYHNTGQLEKALDVYDTELMTRDSDWARMGLAKIYTEQNRLKEAEALFLELIATNYMYIEAYEYLTNIYKELEQSKRAEDTLARAVLVSPLSVPRQQRYADLCESNNHYEAAIVARRNLLRIAKNSRHESPANDIDLCRCLTDFCEYKDSYDDEKFTGEVLSRLDAVRNDSRIEGDNELQALLIEARIHHGKGNKVRSGEAMTTASQLYEKAPSSFKAQTQLEYAKSLTLQDETNHAERVLKALVASSSEIEVLMAADRVLDEPVSRHGKQRIVELNRAGINHFRDRAFDLAVDAFRQAQAYFPKNVEINLNLVHGLLTSIRSSTDEGDRENWLSEAEQCLAQVRHIKSEHNKYENYRRLQASVQSLHDELAA